MHAELTNCSEFYSAITIVKECPIKITKGEIVKTQNSKKEVKV